MPTETEARAAAVQKDARWTSLKGRDAAADGGFYYGVTTTGVYCRPSCAARTPRPENVVFFASTRDADAAGFRPCKRCTPGGPTAAARNAERVAELCRMLDAEGEALPLAELARRAGMSAHHLHRLFRSVTGLTPRAYAAAARAARARAERASGGTVTQAVLGAGGHPGRHERARRVRHPPGGRSRGAPPRPRGSLPRRVADRR
jgi:AraC family transcriptional regulator of adaptative response/methylated-DNA-[protein]-cysteine methyltransferase